MVLAGSPVDDTLGTSADELTGCCVLITAVDVWSTTAVEVSRLSDEGPASWLTEEELTDSVSIRDVVV